MLNTVFKFMANAAIIVGLFLFVRLIYGAANGSLVAQLFPASQESLKHTVIALGLGIPVPLHVVSVGLILQRRRLPNSWARISLPAVVISGCWLGAALAVRFFVLG